MVLDPNVSGTVTVIASQPLDKDGVWELFQSVLSVQGFAALPSGGLWRIVPQQAIKEGGGLIGAASEGPGAAADTAPGRLDVITRLVTLQNFPAETALAAGHLAETIELLRKIDDAASSGGADKPLLARIEAVQGEVARLKGWQHWGGGRVREDLVIEAEALAEAEAEVGWLTLGEGDEDRVSVSALAAAGSVSDSAGSARRKASTRTRSPKGSTRSRSAVPDPEPDPPSARP